MGGAFKRTIALQLLGGEKTGIVERQVWGRTALSGMEWIYYELPGAEGGVEVGEGPHFSGEHWFQLDTRGEVR